MALVREFSKSCEDVFIASDDGSVGHKGFVTDLLKNSIESGNKIEKNIYLRPKTYDEDCGGNRSQQWNKLSGIYGRENGLRSWGLCYLHMYFKKMVRKRVCKDGPIFNASEVDFDG